MSGQPLAESAGPMIHRIAIIVEELARNGSQFTIKAVLKRLNQWAPIRGAVASISRDFGQMGLPYCTYLGQRDVIRMVLNAGHPKFRFTPKYQGLVVSGQTEKIYKASEFVTATELRNLVVPILRRAGGLHAEVEERLRHADLLDQNGLDCLGDLLLPKYEPLLLLKVATA